MPQTATRQSSRAPDRSDTVADPADETRPPPSMGISDIALASAVARVVSATPGVATLSPGLTAPVATYGPGQRVAGIVIRHPSGNEVVLEVHVVLSESYCKLDDAKRESLRNNPAAPGPVTEIANRIRTETRHTVESMVAEHVASPGSVRVDVFIDDLR